MSKRKPIEGVCKLCFKETTLNYEHVPPRSAFNKHTKFINVPFQDYLRDYHPDKKMKGYIKQGGVGYYSFCENCNNFLGTDSSGYVNEFKEWTYVGRQMLNEGDFKTYEYDIHNVSPSKVIKQVLSMFLAINDLWFSETHKEISQFVLDPKSTELPDKYKVYMYLTKGPHFRHSPVTWSGSLVTGNINITMLSEVSFPPYGYVLTIDSTVNKPLAEITNFSKAPSDLRTTLNCSIPRHDVNILLPIDFRSKDEIKNALDNSDSN